MIPLGAILEGAKQVIKDAGLYLSWKISKKRKLEKKVKNQRKQLEEAIESKNASRVINWFIRTKRM